MHDILLFVSLFYFVSSPKFLRKRLIQIKQKKIVCIPFLESGLDDLRFFEAVLVGVVGVSLDVVAPVSSVSTSRVESFLLS